MVVFADEKACARCSSRFPRDTFPTSGTRRGKIVRRPYCFPCMRIVATTPGEATGHDLRKCRRCDKTKRTVGFPSRTAQVCNACEREKARERKGFRCPRCNELRPRHEFPGTPGSTVCIPCVEAGPPPRRCSSCRRKKPAIQFVRGGRTCYSCKKKRKDSLSRICRRCGETKTIKEGFRPRSPICLDCRAREKAEHDERLRVWAEKQKARSATRETPDGRERRCPRCDEWKNEDRDYSLSGKRADGSRRPDAFCKKCRSKMACERDRRLRNDPATREEYLRGRREYLRRHNHIKRLQRDGVDPELAESFDPLPPNGYEPVPCGPLLKAVESYLERRILLGDDRVATLNRLGIWDRRLYGWRNGQETTHFELADRLLIAMDLLPWDVWDPVEYPEVMKLFGFDEVTVA